MPRAVGGGGGGGGLTSVTLLQAYQFGALAADQTLLIAGANGGPVIFKGNAPATGSLVKAATSTGTILMDIPDNGTHLFRSAMADGAAAIAAVVDTSTPWSTAGAKLLSIRNNAVEKFFVDYTGTIYVPASAGVFNLAGTKGLVVDYLGSATVSYGGGHAPGVDQSYSLGNATYRWVDIYQGNNSVEDTQTVGISLSNKAVAATGDQKYSPTLRLEGRRYSGAVSQTMAYDIQTLAESDGTLRPTLRFWATKDATQTAWIDFTDSGFNTPRIQSGTLPASGIDLDSNLYFRANGSKVLPHSDITHDLGYTANRWLSIYQGNDSVGASLVTGIELSNKAIASTGAQKYSPALSLRGTRYSGAASKTIGFDLQASPRTIASATADGTDAGSLYITAHYDGATTDLWGFDHNGGVPRLRPLASPGIIASQDGTNTISLYNSVFTMGGAGIRPDADGTVIMGGGGWPWKEVCTKTLSSGQAPTYTISSNAISPTFGFFFISSGLLKTINLTNLPFAFNGMVMIIPTDTGGGAFTWDATGNIAAAGASTVNEPVVGWYDSVSAKWYLR